MERFKILAIVTYIVYPVDEDYNYKKRINITYIMMISILSIKSRSALAARWLFVDETSFDLKGNCED